MDVTEAQTFVNTERAGWHLGVVRISDDELLRRRARLYNGLSTIFAFAILIGYFVLPTLWDRIGGEWAAIYGTWGMLFAFFFTALQYGTKAGHCRDVREFLKKQLHESPA